MSNLGGYQIMTTLAKKVGGPKNLAVISLASGYAIFRVGEAGVKKIIKISKKQIAKLKKTKANDIQSFHVTKNGVCDEVNFKVGQQYNVLAKDNDAILIEILGDKNNPYFVSEKNLKEISDYN